MRDSKLHPVLLWNGLAIALLVATWLLFELPPSSPSNTAGPGWAWHLVLETGALAALGMALWRLWQHAAGQARQREQALQNKVDELTTVLNHVPASVCQVGSDGRFLYANDVFAQRAEFSSAKDIIGKRLEDVLPPERHAEATYRLTQALAGQTFNYKYQRRDVAGRLLFSNTIFVAPAPINGKQQAGAVAIGVNDTQLHRLHEELEHADRAKTDLKNALDAHAAVVVTDPQGRILQANQKFCETSGYSAQELWGQTHRTVVDSGHHAPEFFQAIWDTISEGRTWCGEICSRSKNGSLHWVHSTIVPFLGKEGQPRRYIEIRTDITQRKQAELQVQEMAYHDALTGLPNRRLLNDRLEQQMGLGARSGKHGALLLLDLDHFKEVNDTLGHDSGDLLLKEVALRLQECVRASDTVARFGGDEFVVLLADLPEESCQATTLAGRLGENILQALSAPYLLGTEPVACPPSIGITLYQGHTASGTELLKQADIALYQAKENGRMTLCFFDPAVQQEFEKRMALESDLRSAMVQGQFEVFYQPITDATRRTVGMEALLRWRHPRMGLVSPAEFIPLAEKSGLIVPLGQWVIVQACAQLAQWREDPERQAWTIAVNVSARQFRHAGLVPEVLQAMEQSQIHPGQLKLELTESSLQANLAETVAKMNQLRAQGVRFAIDDFGTGYSSLAYLKTLPIDTLKIDRSFVQHIETSHNDAVIATTILALAQGLGLDVVAEGIETDTQLALLHQQGCPHFQGYLLGRPAPAKTLNAVAA